MTTEKRKKDHLSIALRKESQYIKSALFEEVDFVHNALPELDLEDVQLKVSFLGKEVFPLLITGMTGGNPSTKRINLALAEAAEKHNLAFGVGSQRAMVENPSLTDTYKVRKAAPSIPLLANIGAAQLLSYPLSTLENIVSSIDADGLAIHLNALQEVIQPEGDRNFKGILEKIKEICEKVSTKIVVKETGAGISRPVALKLKEAGVDWIDVSGAGGTSWSKVEYKRGKAVPGFGEWGIPAAASIFMCRETVSLIGSGGIRNGIDCAKAVSLGADMAGAAKPFFSALKAKRLDEEIELWKSQMKLTAFLTGSKTLKELQQVSLVMGPNLKRWLS
ncbi:type 2 isopentenyl-diphosphate Delta-isomerase [Candidatus Micrarchaeota archaeon]|nr:type 2 isopentenyl-diphosphate Delta-isomerase [Candidatus Micrarchaeota archaeon]